MQLRFKSVLIWKFLLNCLLLLIFLFYCNNLTLTYLIFRRIYWVDVLKGSIETARLDGTDRHVVKKYGYQNGTLYDRPISIDIFDDNLYIVGMSAGNIWKTHKFGRSTDVFIKKVKAVNPKAWMKIIHPTKRYADTPSMCITNNICGSQPCITMNEIPKCLCNEGQYYDGKSCIQMKWLFASDRPCGNHACKHGGLCNNKSMTCACPPGTFGDNCEHTMCTNACMNNGKCEIDYDHGTDNSKVICNCPIEYMGERCERYKCAGQCGSTGTCEIDNRTGLPYCKCDDGYHGKDCKIRLSTESTTCDDFCYNNGKCSMATSSKPFCQCGTKFSGRRCENCFNYETKKEIICLNGGYCKKDEEMCVCPLGYVGSDCGQDLCKNYCFNGGECVRNGTLSSNPIICSCSTGFSGLRCEYDQCSRNETICKNDGICVVKPDGTTKCACINKFFGDDCSKVKKCEDYCQNESTCEEILEISPDPTNDNLIKKFKCDCQPGYYGEQCENFDACNCEHGGICKVDKEKGPICQCPKGITGEKCEIINATKCDEIECYNSGICIVPGDIPYCACRHGWTGSFCKKATCAGYCQNNGICFIQDNMPICR